MEQLKVDAEPGKISFQINQAAEMKYVMLLAHGAGAGLNHPFLEKLASGISKENGTVIRFNFPYMEAGKKLPGAPGPNIKTIGLMITHTLEMFPDTPVILSGKSYGGRMSSHWMSEHPDSKAVKALVYFGFPLHAPGKPSKQRADHLNAIIIPQLFIQGTRDALASHELIKEVSDSCIQSELHTIQNGDHSFKIPKKQTNLSPDEHLSQIGKASNTWILNQLQ